MRETEPYWKKAGKTVVGKGAETEKTQIVKKD